MSKRRETLCTVAGCNQPVRDSLVCQSCADALAEALGDVPALAGELETTITRQSRLGTGGRSSNRPLVFAWDPSVMRNALRNTLTTWTRVLHDTHGGELPADTIPAVARWLLARVDWLRAHPAAAEAVDEITACVDDCRRAVDRPPELWYAGRCGYIGDEQRMIQAVYGEPATPCEADLYATPGAGIIQCPRCKATYNVEQRRTWLLDAVDDTRAHAELIARALSRLGQPVTSAMIRGYAHRGRLVPHGVDHHGRPTYCVGDVRRLLIEQAKKETEKQAS